MVLHDVRDIQDLRDVRLTRLKDQAEKVLVKTTMIIVTAQFGEKPVLELTDFTSLYKKVIHSFPVKSGSEAAQHFKELKRSYSIEEDLSKKKARGDNKTHFLDNGYFVLLTIVAEAYNGTTGADFKLTEFKILNKSPVMIKKLTRTQHVKVTSLMKSIESRDAFKTSNNRDELDKIIQMLTSSNTAEISRKKPKLESTNSSSQESPNGSKSTTQEQTPPVHINQSPFPSNPLFIPPPQGLLDSQAGFTQMIGDSDLESEEETNLERNTIVLDACDNDVEVKQEPGSDVRVVEENEAVFKSQKKLTKEKEVEKERDEEEEEELELEDEEEEYGKDVIGAIGESFRQGNFQTDDSAVVFTGYILGTEPLNFQIIGKAFNSKSINTTGFRLFLTNFPPHLLRNFKINENCISVEFSSKDQILTFFGYDNIEEACRDHDKIQEKLRELLNKKNQMNFNIQRSYFGITRGKKLVFELTDTIDQLLEQK